MISASCQTWKTVENRRATPSSIISDTQLKLSQLLHETRDFEISSRISLSPSPAGHQLDNLRVGNRYFTRGSGECHTACIYCTYVCWGEGEGWTESDDHFPPITERVRVSQVADSGRAIDPLDSNYRSPAAAATDLPPFFFTRKICSENENSSVGYATSMEKYIRHHIV